MYSTFLMDHQVEISHASNGTVYRYNGTTWLVDSATTTSTFDSRYLNTGGDGIVSGSSQITDGSGIVSGSVVSSLPSGTVSGSTQITDGSGILSGSITSQLPSGVISGSSQITSTDLDMSGNKVLFGNVYSTLGDLPNAINISWYVYFMYMQKEKDIFTWWKLDSIAEWK